MKNLAFIGLGIMGSPIAGHLAAHGHSVKVFNRTTSRALAWIKKHGGEMASTPAEAASDAEFIFSCVGGDDDLREVITGEHGALSGMCPGSILVDHSTVSARISMELGDICAHNKFGFLDAPLSGGQKGAEDGNLSIMCGGEATHFEKAKPIISSYAKRLVHMGSIGNGQLTKMVNQICVASIIQGLAEGLYFAKKKKLNIDDLLQVIKNGAGQSWQLENRGKTMWRNEFNFGFMNKLMLKDLNLIFDEIKSSNYELPITKLIKRKYKKLMDMGFEEEDTSNLIRLLK